MDKDCCCPGVLDPQVASIIKGEMLVGARQSAALTMLADRNATQGLTVVNTTLIQQHGSTADDAATFASLRATRIVPQPDA